jgi:hypothetical protein
MEDITPHFTVVQSIEESDVIVLWQDVVGFCKSFSHLAKARGKKIVVIQHGVNAMDDYGPPNYYESTADKICVWSQNDIDMLKSFKISPKKYVLTGTTIWSHLKPKTKHEGINVLFKPAHWDVDVAENYIVRDALRKIKGIRVMTKVHERSNLNNDEFDNVTYSNRETPGHLDVCGTILAETDIMVGIASEGTLGLLGYGQDIPMIIPDIWEPRTFLNAATPEMKYTDACTKVKLEDLEKSIKYAIKHPEFKREERKQVAEYYGGISIPSPIDNIIKVIETI